MTAPTPTLSTDQDIGIAGEDLDDGGGEGEVLLYGAGVGQLAELRVVEVALHRDGGCGRRRHAAPVASHDHQLSKTQQHAYRVLHQLTIITR